MEESRATTSAISRYRHNRAQMLRLDEWLRENESRLADERTDRIVAAKQAQEELGFRIGPTHIAGMLKAMTKTNRGGLQSWPCTYRRPKKDKGISEYLKRAIDDALSERIGEAVREGVEKEIGRLQLSASPG